MKVGDFVHNVPRDEYGLIVEEGEPIVDDKGNVVEQVFMILYDTRLGLGGSSFLEVISE